MKIYDISVTISEALPTWPGDPALSIELASSMARGDEANVTRLCLGAHTGTHIDAPSHFEPNGLGVDALPLDILIGPCRVFDLTGEPGPIGRGALSRCDFQGVSRALFKTKNSDLWHQTENRFQKGFIGIAPEGPPSWSSAASGWPGSTISRSSRFKAPAIRRTICFYKTAW
ncbi:MAG: cyclase family protein [Candidatus Manganitrophus sp.]|nr:cyclase family protein [Candidatus Manganitrophus sp.]